MVHISSEESGNGRSREELNFFAAIISSCEAWLAFVADNIRFNGYTISDFEMFHRWVYGQDDSRRFVSKYVGIFNNHRTDAASMPEVNVGSEDMVSGTSSIDYFIDLPAYSSALDSDRHFARLQAITLLNTLQRWFRLSHP